MKSWLLSIIVGLLPSVVFSLPPWAIGEELPTDFSKIQLPSAETTSSEPDDDFFPWDKIQFELWGGDYHISVVHDGSDLQVYRGSLNTPFRKILHQIRFEPTMLEILDFFATGLPPNIEFPQLLEGQYVGKPSPSNVSMIQADSFQTIVDRLKAMGYCENPSWQEVGPKANSLDLSTHNFILETTWFYNSQNQRVVTIKNIVGNSTDHLANPLVKVFSAEPRTGIRIWYRDEPATGELPALGIVYESSVWRELLFSL